MTKFVSALVTLFVAVLGIAIVSPALTLLAHALVPLVLVVGVVAAVLRVVWVYTRRW